MDSRIMIMIITKYCNCIICARR